MFGRFCRCIGCAFKYNTGHGRNDAYGRLFTESIIFFFSAFEPLHEEVDWSLVYPELAGIPDEETGEIASHRERRGAISGGGGGGGSLALSRFDEMLEKAEITPELFQKLGVGMKKLSESTESMNAMGEVSAASTKYMNTINTANESLGRLTETIRRPQKF